MHTKRRLTTKKGVATPLLLTAVFNTVIALFLTHLGFGRSLEANFIVSQAIGLCMCVFVLAGFHAWKGSSGAGTAAVVFGCIACGAGTVAFFGAQLSGLALRDMFRGDPSLYVQMLAIGVVFGTPITYFFISREKIARSRSELQDEQIKRLTLEKKTVEAHLKSLQAQVEPHFLFNTLSNVLSLIDSDPHKSKRMLEDLTRYLRASLATLRRESATLGEEIELIRTYLDIHTIRMGERLSCRIDAPENLHDMPFPPMLLQPLVENALKHGIEPKLEGGHVAVEVIEGQGRVVILVADTGCGLPDAAPVGVGLASVRERLQAVYDGRAELSLRNNHPSGLTVVLEIPDERRQGPDRR
jgi:signal transduction histidine kinase